MRPLVALGLLLILLLTACGGAAPTATLPVGKCPSAERTQTATILQDHGKRWDDAVTLANSTPRNQLAGQIAPLQQIRREVEAAAWPACAAPVRSAMLGMMDATIAGFLDFLAQRDATANFALAESRANEMIEASKNLAP